MAESSDEDGPRPVPGSDPETRVQWKSEEPPRARQPAMAGNALWIGAGAAGLIVLIALAVGYALR